MERPDYRWILPATRESSRGPSEPFLKRKRSQITRVACNPCRTKKTACDGARPVCTPCLNRESSQCSYQSIDISETPMMVLKRENENLKQNLAALDELVNSMRFMPADISTQIFQRLRITSDPLSILQVLKGEMIDARPSEKAAALGILPSVQTDLEFELMVRHPLAYPALDSSEDALLYKMPIFKHRESQKKEIPLHGNSDTAASASRAQATQPVISGPASAKGKGIAREDSDPIDPALPNSGPDPMIYFDRRLYQLDVSFWSTVEVSNELVAGAISLYLETDHWFLGLFDANLFVQDLIGQKRNFCSAFLVNSLLGLAMQSFTAKEPDALARSYEFENEATKMSRDADDDSILNIAAYSLLFLSLTAHGRNTKAGLQFLKEAAQMSIRLRLFGIEDVLTLEDLEHLSLEQQVALAHTAWGAFNLVTLQGLFYIAAPTESPPALPIPSGYSVPDTEKSSKTPSSPTRAETFAIFCSFWTIVHEILLVYNPKNRQHEVSLDFALSKYNELLTWADTLPKSMFRNEHAPSHVLVFHVWYHVVMLDIFRPFLTEEQQHDFSTWLDAATSPQSIFSASVKQMKRIIIVFRANHPSAKYSIFWHPALLYVANSVIKDLSDPEWRFYFLLCIHSYQSLFTSFPIVEAIVQGLLSLAVHRGAITLNEARAMNVELGAKASVHKLREKVRGAFMVDLDLAVTNVDEATVDRLADRFEEITTFDEFTRGVI